MKLLTAALIASVTATSAPAIAASGPDFDELDGFIRTTKHAISHPAGTAVAVVRNGKVIHEGYFGFADIHGKRPVTRDTVFYIASTTKPFMALNALLHEHAKRVETTITLQAMFPDIRFDGFDAGSVTMKDLLVHTAGVDNEPLVWATAFSGMHDAGSRRELVAASYPSDAVSQGTFRYTNVGYNILSVWLDQVVGTPWQAQLDEAIFGPLGMTRTTACISEAEARGWPLAQPYSFASTDPDEPLYLSKADSTMHAAGGLVSTAPDLARFLMAQLDEGRHAGRQVLPRSVIEASHLAQAVVDDSYLDFERTGYAWGWYTGEYKGRSMLHHFGSFAGFHAHLSFMPEQNIGLVVLNNEDVLSARLTSLIADHVYGVLLDEPGIGPKMSARFDALLDQAGELRSSVAVHREKIAARDWTLSQPLEAYVGTYSNDLLGNMTVALDGDASPVIRWGRLQSVATGHDRLDHMRVEFAPHSGELLAFHVSDGQVDSLSFGAARFRKTR